MDVVAAGYGCRMKLRQIIAIISLVAAPYGA
jgi:hypothetical protein